jgi:integrase
LHSFLFPNSEGNLEGHSLRKVQQIANRAGLDGSTFSLHSWRRTFATRLHDNGVGVRKIQYYLGHTELTTTLRYLGLTADNSLSEAEREAFDSMHVY